MITRRQRGLKCGIRLRAIGAACAIAMALMAAGSSATAQTYTALHKFTGTPDGSAPWSGLAMDRAGNLYGTTQWGGAYGWGYVFKMARKNGSWVISPLYSFPAAHHGGDGNEPMAGVTIGPDGSLYGTTSAGGNFYGTVFNLKPPIAPCKSFLCPWTETVLYRFNGSDGNGPEAPVVFDQAGNLYGTTTAGGSMNLGVVFELTRSGSNWTESVLHSFTGDPDGWFIRSGLTLDAAGNLYGASVYGGSFGSGTVFEVSPSGSGWTENVLYSFAGGSDGALPFGAPILDKYGNLYGTAAYSDEGNGSVYELTPAGDHWNFSVLYDLMSEQAGLPGPIGPLLMDTAGNLYGTSFEGGDPQCEYGCGSVFEVTPSSGGWSYSLLYQFRPSDLAFPVDGLVSDSSGNLYGIASGGGEGGGGVFEITP